MIKDHRHKLLNFWCSLLVLALASTGGLAALLLGGYRNPDLGITTGEPLFLVVFVAEAMGGFAIILVPVLIWHVLDIIRPDQPALRPLRIVCDYRAFLLGLTFTAASMSISSSAIFTKENCPENVASDGTSFGFVTCFLAPPFWLALLIYLGLAGLAVLCLCKLASMLISPRRFAE